MSRREASVTDWLACMEVGCATPRVGSGSVCVCPLRSARDQHTMASTTITTTPTATLPTATASRPGIPNQDRGAFTAMHQDALELDVSILEALLHRNRSSHQRTKYYQHMDMAVRCIRRRTNILTASSSSSSSSSSLSLLTPISLVDLFPETERIKEELNTCQDNFRTKRKRNEIFWEIASGEKKKKDDHEASPPGLISLSHQLQSLHWAVSQHLPEALSRLDDAAPAFFLELARGYFVPFCTVAVAAVARVRMLLLYLGHHVAGELVELQSRWNDTFPQLQSKDLFSNNQELVEQQTSLYAQSQERRPSSVKAVRRELTKQQSLKRIGITLRSSHPPKNCRAGRKDQSVEGTSDDEGHDKLTPKAELASSMDHEAASMDNTPTRADAGATIHNDMDIGENVDFSVDHAQWTARSESLPVDRDTVVAQPFATHELDTNLALVQKLKKGKKKRATKDKETALMMDDDKEESGKKKTKRRKKTKGDFFDELFG